MKKLILIAVVMVTMMSSCSSYMATGAAFGGMLGSAIGGITGGPRGSDVGTLIGVTAGAVAGAAAEAHEQEMYERRIRAYNDDVYYSPEASGRDVAKAKRIQSYHDKVANRGYSARSNAYGARRNGYRFERANATEPQVSTVTTVPRDTVDNSGYVKEGKYDDRIEMK